MNNKSERYLKEKAFRIFLKLISGKNRSLAEYLESNRSKVYKTVIRHIQRVGVHKYAELVSKRHSPYREELDDVIAGDER